MNTAESHSIESTSAGHEPVGVSVRFVVWGAIGLALLILLTMWAMGGVSRLLSHGAERPDDSTAVPTSASTVGLGLNQTAQREEMAAEQERWLREYAWLDQNQLTARIPIARAMQIMAERGIVAASVSDDEDAPPNTQDLGQQNQ